MTDPKDESSSCGCGPRDETRPWRSCADKPNPFTAEELEIFEKLLGIKKTVRKIKRRMTDGDGDREALAARLETLRAEWRVWKARSAEAARQRMILLGHIGPGNSY